jgi:hypothetical protein
MISEAIPAALNPWQMRAVSVTLRLVEDAMMEIERLLATVPDGITFRLVDDVTVNERRQIMVLCCEVRAAVATVHGRLRAGVFEHSLRGKIRGQVGTLWATLQDTKSRALRGYGPLAEQDGAVVDELLEDILRPLTSIFRLVAEPYTVDAAQSPRTEA